MLGLLYAMEGLPYIDTQTQTNLVFCYYTVSKAFIYNLPVYQ